MLLHPLFMVVNKLSGDNSLVESLLPPDAHPDHPPLLVGKTKWYPLPFLLNLKAILLSFGNIGEIYEIREIICYTTTLNG